MKKVVIGLVIAMSLLIVGAVYLYSQSTQSYSRAKSDTIAYVAERTNLSEVDDFFWFNGEETYFTITGTNEDGEERIYIVQQQGGQITTLSAEATISKQEAIQRTRQAREPQKILNARIGMLDGTPVWEVSYRNDNDRLGYYVINLRNGEWIRTIDNI